MFTSLEEAEFERMSADDNVGGYGSTPNLAARSYSRSHSRETSRERRNEGVDATASVDSVPEEDADRKPLLRDLPKLDSFEEEKESTKEKEVTEEEEEVDDFWGNSGD